MDEQKRELGRRHLAAAILSTVAFGALAPGCGVLVDVPPFVRGSNIEADGTCRAGFGDCNGDTDDGCETTLGTDEHCAACGNECGNGSCVPAGEGHVCSCSPGFDTCGGIEDCLVDLHNDPHHCGACDHDCSPGLCREGICQPGLVIHDLNNFNVATPFVVNDGYVYAPGYKNMVRAPADGTTELVAAQVMFSSTRMIQNLAWDGTHLAWVERPLEGGSSVSVHVGSLDGKEDRVLSESEEVQIVDVYTAQPIALDADNVYWMISESQGVHAKPTSLRVAPIDGTKRPTTVITTNGSFGTIAVGTDYVYWNDSDDRIHVHPKQDLGKHVDIRLGDYVSFITANGDRVCASSYSSSAVYAIDFYCGERNERASFVKIGHTANGQVGSLVFDAGSLYYTDVLGAELVRIDASSMRSATIAPTIGWAGGTVIVGEDLYWRAYNGIWRLRHAIHAAR